MILFVPPMYKHYINKIELVQIYWNKKEKMKWYYLNVFLPWCKYYLLVLKKKKKKNVLSVFVRWYVSILQIKCRTQINSMFLVVKITSSNISSQWIDYQQIMSNYIVVWFNGWIQLIRCRPLRWSYFIK